MVGLHRQPKETQSWAIHHCQFVAQNKMTLCAVMFGHSAELTEWIPGVGNVCPTKQQTGIGFSVQFEFRMHPEKSPGHETSEAVFYVRHPRTTSKKKAVTIIKNWESEKKLGVGSDCILQHFCFHWVIPVTVLKELARVWPLLCKVLGFPGGSVVKNPPAIQETWVPSLGREDPLEEEMATHSSMLAWKIRGRRSLEGHSPWTWLSD